MQIERKNDLIKFTDTSGISHDIWEKMLARINYLNYGIPDTDELKKYFDKHVFLQPDQSHEILKILNLMHDEDNISEDIINNANQKAKEYFGTTDRLSVAGYLLTDGDLLNFSYDGITRGIDHRDIKDVLEDIDTSETNAVAMIEFMNYGNIRLMSYGFDTTKRPTNKQRPLIAAFTKRLAKLGSDMQVDISNTNGDIIKSFSYDFPMYSEVMTDIDDYFNSIEI